MAKPDLVNALVKTTGEVVGDKGTSSNQTFQGTHSNLNIQQIPATSGTIVVISGSMDVLILTPQTGISFVPLLLPPVSSTATGRVITIKNQQEPSVLGAPTHGPALRFFPSTGDTIEALDANDVVDFPVGPTSVSFVNTGSSWDILRWSTLSGSISFP